MCHVEMYDKFQSLKFWYLDVKPEASHENVDEESEREGSISIILTGQSDMQLL